MRRRPSVPSRSAAPAKAEPAQVGEIDARLREQRLLGELVNPSGRDALQHPAQLAVAVAAGSPRSLVVGEDEDDVGAFPAHPLSLL